MKRREQEEGERIKKLMREHHQKVNQEELENKIQRRKQNIAVQEYIRKQMKLKEAKNLMEKQRTKLEGILIRKAQKEEEEMYNQFVEKTIEELKVEGISTKPVEILKKKRK